MDVNKPYVIIFSTITVDGKIASKAYFSELSCNYDKIRKHKLRTEVDAIMVGGNTVVVDDPHLTIKYFPANHKPIRVIIDGKLKVPIERRVFNVPPETIVYTSHLANMEKINKLINQGVKVVIMEEYPLSMRKVLMDLALRGISKVMVEGGGELIWHLLREKLVDEMRVTISPYVFGGKAVSLVMGEGFSNIDESPKLMLVSYYVCQCGNEIHLIYKVNY
jgi:2,5-diamino-6-(ribosylamino)-4(3H)-pyrimidinone 5'-phosphate reductase